MAELGNYLANKWDELYFGECREGVVSLHFQSVPLIRMVKPKEEMQIEPSVKCTILYNFAT